MLLAVIMFGLQVLWRGHLTGVDEYDDGVYFGAAINLVHGVLPFSGYAFLQPPGIAVVLAPFAFAARWTGTAHAFEAARVFIAVLGIANVWLMGRLLRHRPTSELVVAMTIMAVYPGALASAQTVLIEPVVVVLCLLGLVVLFEEDQLTVSRRRQVTAGVVLGLAVATKVWALAPLLVLAVVLWRASRTLSGITPVARLFGGAWAGFLVVCAPLAGAAPRASFHEVFVVQATRYVGGYSWRERLQNLSGTTLLVHESATTVRGQHTFDAVLVAVAVFVVAVVAVSWRTARPVLPLEVVGISTTLLVAVSFKFAHAYYYHYSGFVAPFLALAATRAVTCLVSGARRPDSHALARRIGAGGSLAVVGVLLPAIAVADVTFLARSSPKPQITAAFRDALPVRGCILHLQPALGLLADRFTANERGCPAVVDYLGEERTLDRGLAQLPEDETTPALQRLMLRWMSSSSVVVVGGMVTSWGPEVSAYVSQHFVAVDVPSQQVIVYTRKAPPSG
jgi:alpha-1,2-mannosyltransferase